VAHRVPPLRSGHHLQLLEGSVELFPAMVAAIDAAQTEVRLETYIFDFNGGSADIVHALERAARRGVAVQVVVDGVGSGEVPQASVHRLELTGVQWHVYSPTGVLGLLWPGHWRRLHRKLCVVDRTVGFCGGVNILDDFHDPNHGALSAPRLDFAVRVTGPLVVGMHQAMERLWRRMDALQRLRKAQLAGSLMTLRASGTQATVDAPPLRSHGMPRGKAGLLMRDNVRNRATIERAYLRAIGRAREEIIIANAYFVPGGRMRRALANAARRGVRVRLLLQGRYEYFMQYYGSRPVFGALLRAGVEIFEYEPSFLHAKVAVVDQRWATVGSSNLDPLSLLLAREANVVVEDPAFAGRLHQRLLHAVESEGRRMDPADYERRPASTRAKEWLALVIMRALLLIQGKKYL
jgi:cardiolipin synthase